MSTTEQIPRLYNECLRLFDALLESDAQSDVSQNWSRSQQARLKLWAGSLGVSATGRLSLSYRLKLDEAIATMVLQLMQGILSCLQEISGQIVGGQVVQPKVRAQVIAYDPVNLSDTLQDAYDDAESNIDLLQELGTDLRRLDTQREEYRALAYEPVGADGKALAPEFEIYVAEQCPFFLARSRLEVQEAGAIITEESVTDSNKTLLNALQSQVQGDGTQALLARLQRLVLQRWRLLNYRRHHTGRLAADVRSDEYRQERRRTRVHGVSNKLPWVQGREFDIASSGVTSSAAQESALQSPSILGAARSPRTSSNEAARDEDFPSAPTIVDGVALCPICCIALSEQEVEEGAWRAHVLHDLAPYFCIFEECAHADARYTSSNLLWQHFNTEHVTSCWSCPRCQEHTFQLEDDFTAHLNAAHSEEFITADLPFIIEQAVESRPLMLETCVFCLGHGIQAQQTSHEHWRSLVEHMAHDHMRSLALLSLPKGRVDPRVGLDDQTAHSDRESLHNEFDELLGWMSRLGGVNEKIGPYPEISQLKENGTRMPSPSAAHRNQRAVVPGTYIYESGYNDENELEDEDEDDKNGSYNAEDSLRDQNAQPEPSRTSGSDFNRPFVDPMPSRMLALRPSAQAVVAYTVSKRVLEVPTGRKARREYEAGQSQLKPQSSTRPIPSRRHSPSEPDTAQTPARTMESEQRGLLIELEDSRGRRQKYILPEDIKRFKLFESKASQRSSNEVQRVLDAEEHQDKVQGGESYELSAENIVQMIDGAPIGTARQHSKQSHRPTEGNTTNPRTRIKVGETFLYITGGTGQHTIDYDADGTPIITLGGNKRDTLHTATRDAKSMPKPSVAADDGRRGRMPREDHGLIQTSIPQAEDSAITNDLGESSRLGDVSRAESYEIVPVDGKPSVPR